MADPQGILRYNGMAADGSWSYVMASRRTPSVFSANFILGAPIPRFATITMHYDGQTVVMPDCKCKRLVIQREGGGGRWQSCLIEDWRWKWAFGYIYGNYNTFQKGIYQVDSKKNLSELAQLCLAKMGVTASTTFLPEIYPQVKWDGQPPAIELERLLDLVGYEIVPRWNNQIEIVKVGQGQGISFNQTMMDTTLMQEPPVIPEKLFVDSTATLWQEDLLLEPIGYEKDSTEPRRIDDLTYTPFLGWDGKNHPFTFGKITNETDNALAKKYIWKHWRIVGPVELTKIGGGKFTVHSGGEWRLLPLSHGQLELYKAEESDEVKPPQVIGFFNIDTTGQLNNATEAEIQGAKTGSTGYEFKEGSSLEDNNPEWVYKGVFTVDVERGVVVFSKPMYLNTWDPAHANVIGVEGAYIKLRIAFTVRNNETRHKLRKDYEMNPPGGVPGVEYVLSPERLVWEQGRQQSSDLSKFNAEAQGFAQKELSHFGDGTGYKIPMKGLIFNVQLDGKYRSLRFKGGDGGGATTHLEWGMESPDERLTYSEKLRQLEIQDAIDGVKKSISDNRSMSITSERHG